MKHIFILYSFSIVDVYIFSYKFGQTLCSLTLTKSYMQSKKKRREYEVELQQATSIYGGYLTQMRARIEGKARSRTYDQEVILK